MILNKIPKPGMAQVLPLLQRHRMPFRGHLNLTIALAPAISPRNDVFTSTVVIYIESLAIFEKSIIGLYTVADT